MDTKNYPVVLVYMQPKSLPGYKTPYQEEHLGLAYVAASLQREGIQTFIIRSSECISADELAMKILKLEPLIVGFSPTFLTINAVLNCAEKIKKLRSAIHITIGGRQATFTAEEILRNESSVDSIVIGEGEETIVDLTRRVIDGAELCSCLGIWYRDAHGRICKNPERPIVKNLDLLPYPVRNLDPDSPYQWVQMVTSRGCIHHCSFCTTPDWLKLQSQRDQDLLKLFKSSGLEQVGIGLEAGSTSALRIYNKPTSPILNRTACQFLVENNVFTKIGFIMFNPYSTFNELYENAKFLGEISQACYSRYFLKSLEIHHGTGIRRQLEKDGLLLSHYYRSDDFQYRFLHPEVKPFALAMRELLTRPSTARLNNSLYLSDIAVVRSIDSGKPLPDLDAYQAVREELGEFNVQSFLRWVSLAQEGWSERAWTNLCSEYLRAIVRFTAEIKGFNYESYLD